MYDTKRSQIPAVGRIPKLEPELFGASQQGTKIVVQSHSHD